MQTMPLSTCYKTSDSFAGDNWGIIVSWRKWTTRLIAKYGEKKNRCLFIMHYWQLQAVIITIIRIKRGDDRFDKMKAGILLRLKSKIAVIWVWKLCSKFRGRLLMSWIWIINDIHRRHFLSQMVEIPVYGKVLICAYSLYSYKGYFMMFYYYYIVFIKLFLLSSTTPRVYVTNIQKKRNKEIK